eukprot:7263787-Pyramimonas_sp.AAC.1
MRVQCARADCQAVVAAVSYDTMSGKSTTDPTPDLEPGVTMPQVSDVKSPSDQSTFKTWKEKSRVATFDKPILVADGRRDIAAPLEKAGLSLGRTSLRTMEAD